MRGDAALRDLVARSCRDVADFADLSASCLGAWPVLVRDILLDIDDDHCRRLLASASGPKPRIASDPRLPLAHPLDADWRFTRDSAETILDHALAATPAGGSLLLVAMPTVALAAHDRGLSHRIAVGSRRGDPIDDALRAAMPGGRFQDPARAPSRPYDTVAFDPPWYDDVATHMIATAAAQAAPGAAVFVCVPDRLTLPSAAPLLSSLGEAPQALGFDEGAAVGPIRYAMPFFEQRCLQACGVTNVDRAWRTGILLRCRRGRRLASAASDARANASHGPLPAKWSETTSGAIRIWRRTNASVVRGAPQVGVAASISARDPLRDEAWLWTSGNLVAVGDEPRRRASEPCGPATFTASVRLREDITAALEAEAAEILASVDFEVG